MARKRISPVLLSAKTAPSLIEEARRRYADLYDFAPVAYLTLDRAGRIQEANLTATRLLGVPRVRLIGAPLARLVRVSDAKRFADHLQRCFTRRAEIVTELAFPVGDSGALPVQVSSTPIFDDDGEAIECRTTLTDVSALKRSEERLSLLSDASLLLSTSLDHEVCLADVLRLIVSRFADLALVDLVEQDGSIRRAGQAASTPSLLPPSPRSAPTPPQVGKLAAGRPHFIADCSPSGATGFLGPEMEALIRRTRASTLIIVPLVSRGIGFGILTLIATARRGAFSLSDLATAENLAARIAATLDNARLHQLAREAVQAREDVLAFVTHDLKNPLYALMLCMMGAEDRAPEVERRRGWPHVERVRRIARQMSRIVGDLSDFCGLDGGGFAIEPAACPVPNLLDDVLDSLLPLAEEKGIALRLQTPVVAGPVWCDAERALQIFSTLIAEALAATPPSGTVEVGSKLREDGVLFTVRDHATSVRRAELGHIFDRYGGGQPGTPHTTQNRHGFGLYLAKRLVEAQGGAIWCESEPDAGRTISFTLPRRADH